MKVMTWVRKERKNQRKILNKTEIMRNKTIIL